MFQSLMLFLAPAASSAATPLAGATQTVQPSPPAAAVPAPAGPGRRRASLRFLARVIGSAFGFAVLFTGGWFTLRLMAVFLSERL
ncbi:MAG: hypothetical protein MUE63_08800 [Xanthomonadales bacterium]|jgi:hypothetical protein|nr:hypothetical protein [Xanthomonadales bacterium]